MKKIIVTVLTVLTVIGAGVTAYGANTYSAPVTGSSGVVFRHGGPTSENGSSGRVFRPGGSYGIPDKDRIVYIAKNAGTKKGGKRIYHTDPTCRNIRYTPTAKRLSEVKEGNYALCEHCADRDRNN